MKHYVCLLALTLLLCGCSKAQPDPLSDASAAKGGAAKLTAANAGASSEKTPKLIPAPDAEPSEAVLRKLQFQQYEEIEKAGGLPLTVSASGKSFTLRIKLYEVRKEGCKPSPQSPKGSYECNLLLTSSWSKDGGLSYDEPSEKGARFGVKWDAEAGAWVSD